MRTFSLALLIAASLIVLSIAPASIASPSWSGRALPLGSSVSGFVGDATYGSRDLSNSASAGAAISLGFDHPFTFHFSWFTEGAATGTPFAITDAVLHVELFGQTVWTRDQAFRPAESAGAGQTNLTSDLTQDQHLFEGLLLFQVALLSDTRGTVWSESFYVHATEPYHLTVVTIGMALACLFELIALARVGPQALPELRPKSEESATGESDEEPPK